MMRTLIVVAAGLGLGLVANVTAAGSPKARRTDVIACAPQDAFADAFRDWAVRIATGADSTARTRQRLGIPPLADTVIVFVTDPSLCDTAARRHAVVAEQDTLAPPAVHLLRLGTYRYVAFNGKRAGEWSAYFVFDQAFNFVVGYAM